MTLKAKGLTGSFHYTPAMGLTDDEIGELEEYLMFHNYSDGPENPEIIVDYWYINDNEEDPYRYTYVGLFMDGGDDETPTFILVRFDKSVDKRPTIRRINVPERFWQLELGKTGVNLLRRGNDGWLDIIHGYIDGIIENPDAWLEWPSRL